MAAGERSSPPVTGDSVKTFTDCPSCASLCLGPVVLLCGHFICRRCFYEVFQQLGQRPACCQCGQPLDLPEERGLTVNQLVQRMGRDPVMEQLVLQELERKVDIRCLHCPNKMAESVCLDCQEYYCDVCSINHGRSRSGQGHVLYPLPQASQNAPSGAQVTQRSMTSLSVTSLDSIHHVDDLLPQGLSRGEPEGLEEWNEWVKEEVDLLEQASREESERKTVLNDILSVVQQLLNRVDGHQQVLDAYLSHLPRLSVAQGKQAGSYVIQVRSSDASVDVKMETLGKRLRNVRTCQCPDLSAMNAIMLQLGGLLQPRCEGAEGGVDGHALPCTEEGTEVRVTDLPRRVSEELLGLYFEKKSGGEVENVKLDSANGEAVVTFSTPEAAQTILAQEHRLCGCHIKVNPLTSTTDSVTDAHPPRAPERLAYNIDPPCAPVSPIYTVEVRGLGAETTIDTIQFYFECRRSGGGPVEDVVYNAESGTASVTFEDAEDAARVVNREHRLDGNWLDVQLHHSLQDRVVLRNLPPVTCADELILFVECSRVDQVVDRVLFAEEKGTAVVIFESEIDVRQVRACLSRKRFKQKTVKVGTVPITSTVLVRHMPQVNEDLLYIYFENVRRSDGGDVTDVQVFPDQQCARVTFEDPRVARRVAAREHKIAGHQVQVSLYMECLGSSGGSREPPA